MWPADWRVLHASFVTETAGSTIWRVRLVGAPGTAVAKVLKPAADAADELRGAHYLRWRAGEGAVRLLDTAGLPFSPALTVSRSGASSQWGAM